MNASNTQIGGDHYRAMGAFQPWDVLQHWLTPEEYRGYQKGVIIAYLARERAKGGDQDIAKAAHHLQKLCEVIGDDEKKEPVSFFEAIKSTPDKFQIDPEPEWIDWSGGDCPVSGMTQVIVMLRNGEKTKPAYARYIHWYHNGSGKDIIKYAVVK